MVRGLGAGADDDVGPGGGAPGGRPAGETGRESAVAGQRGQRGENAAPGASRGGRPALSPLLLPPPNSCRPGCFPGAKEKGHRNIDGEASMQFNLYK